MDNQNQTTQYDPQAVAMVRALKMQESGNDYKAPKEKAGVSLGGAYQYQAPTWKAYAGDVLGDSNAEFTPENQDKVTYGMVKKWKDKGMQPNEIAHMWNPGDSKYPDQVVQKLKNIAKNKTTSTSQTNQPPKLKSFDDITDNSPTPSNPELQAGNPTTLGNNGIVNAVASVTPGTKLAQGLGYTINNMLGGQDEVIKANDNSINIQGQLIQLIKQKKAQGQDTSKLESTLKDLTTSIQDTGNKVSDVGTGGISNKDVKSSAIGLATVPALMYGGSVLKGLSQGGGLAQSLLKGSGAISELATPGLETPIIQSVMKAGGNPISAVEKIKLLQQASEIGKGSGYESIISKALGEAEQLLAREQGIAPEVAKGSGLLKKLLVGGGTMATGAALNNIFGNKVGSIVHSAIK